MAAFLVPLLIAVSSWAMKADRYLLPILPISILLAAGTAAELFNVDILARASRARRIAAAVLIVTILGAPLVTAYPNHLRRLRPDTRSAAKEWIEENVHSGSFIVTEAYGPEIMGPHMLSSLSGDVRRAVLEKTAGRPNYAVQRIPMFQVKPERSEVFYDLSLYEAADAAITSGAVRSRHMREPNRFRRQMAFYDSLESRFQVVCEFSPGHWNGPAIIIYRNPRHKVPFGGRENVTGPRPLRHGTGSASGSEEFFYVDLGRNYEAFGHYSEAVASYELGLVYPVIRSEVRNSLILGKTRCLLALDKAGEAAEFLRTAAETATAEAYRARFLELRRQILSRARAPAKK
jgi:hypothetical protein